MVHCGVWNRYILGFMSVDSLPFDESRKRLLWVMIVNGHRVLKWLDVDEQQPITQAVITFSITTCR